MELNPWIPRRRPGEPKAHPRQQRFLLHAHTREVLYGGAAGGGKSDALLMAAAQYVGRPGYAALLLRETFPDLMKPDALIPRSKEWWLGRADWSAQNKSWTFPSGATIAFGYLERDDDVFQYQGAAYQYIGIDELTQHTEFRYRYLFSRLRRRAGVDVPLRMRAGTNPGGRGHEWVFRRFIDPRARAPGALFVPARLDDNPSLDAAAYTQSLAYLDPITRAQLLAGDWNAVAGGRFKREWLKYYGRRGDYYVLGPDRLVHPSELRLVFLTVDPAASEKATADWTVISAWAVTARNELLWLDCYRGHWDVPDIVPEVEKVYRRHGAKFVGVEAVAANNAIYKLARRTKMLVRQLSPAGHDKLVRATPAMVLAESGRLWLPQAAPWLEDAEAEVLRFTGDDKKDAHDDIVDTLSYAVEVLTGCELGGDPRGSRPYVVGR